MRRWVTLGIVALAAAMSQSYHREAKASAYDVAVPPAVMLDRATVDGFRSGDDGAVRSVYKAYSGLVWSVAMRVVRDRALADEATQQTFLQACGRPFRPG